MCEIYRNTCSCIRQRFACLYPMEISRSTMLVYLPMWGSHGKAVNIEEGPESYQHCLTVRLPAISRVLRFGNIYGWSFFHLGSLWLFPSLNEGSHYFIHRLTPLVITSIILSTHSFTTRSITLHFLSEMAYFLVF